MLIEAALSSHLSFLLWFHFITVTVPLRQKVTVPKNFLRFRFRNTGFLWFNYSVIVAKLCRRDDQDDPPAVRNWRPGYCPHQGPHSRHLRWRCRLWWRLPLYRSELISSAYFCTLVPSFRIEYSALGVKGGFLGIVPDLDFFIPDPGYKRHRIRSTELTKN